MPAAACSRWELDVGAAQGSSRVLDARVAAAAVHSAGSRDDYAPRGARRAEQLAPLAPQEPPPASRQEPGRPGSQPKRPVRPVRPVHSRRESPRPQQAGSGRPTWPRPFWLAPSLRRRVLRAGSHERGRLRAPDGEHDRPARPRSTRSGSSHRYRARSKGRVPLCSLARAHVRAHRRGSSSPTTSTVPSWRVARRASPAAECRPSILAHPRRRRDRRSPTLPNSARLLFEPCERHLVDPTA